MKQRRVRLTRSLFWLGALLALLAATALPVLGQPKARTFPETGKTVSGRFLDYWTHNGGLAQQGYPISEEFQEVSETDGKTYTVQYFERAVFELHPENQQPFDVLLSLLGAFTYQQKYPSGASNQTPSSDNPRLFPETGKTLGGKFRTYWENNGGLAQQGLPLSDEFEEVNDLDGKSYTVQYFERAVFELHPENQPPYDVLLSQLGTFRFQDKYPRGEPTPAPGVVPTRVAGCESYLRPGTWSGPLMEQVNFKGEGGIAGTGLITGTLSLDVECNGAFEGTATVNEFSARASKGRIPVMVCTMGVRPIADFNGKTLARFDGLHLLVSGGAWRQGEVICKVPLQADRTEQLANRPIESRDVKVDTISENKITGSQWLANPVIDAVLAQVYAVDPTITVETTTSGHWELTYQGE